MQKHLIFSLFFLIHNIASVPLEAILEDISSTITVATTDTTSTTNTTDSYYPGEVLTKNIKDIDNTDSNDRRSMEQNAGKLLIGNTSTELEDMAQNIKPQFPFEKPEPVHTLPGELSVQSEETILQGWKPQEHGYDSLDGESKKSDENVGEIIEAEPSTKMSNILVGVDDGFIDESNNNNNEDNPIYQGRRKEFLGIPRRFGTNGAHSRNLYSTNQDNGNDGGNDNDNTFGTVDPCPVLKFLCFQDAEYCSSFQVYCDETGSQEAYMKHTLECVMNWITGTGSANCSSVFGR